MVVDGAGQVPGGLRVRGGGFAHGPVLQQHRLIGVFPRAEKAEVDPGEDFEFGVRRPRADGVHAEKAGGVFFFQFRKDRRGIFGIRGPRQPVRIHEGFELDDHEVRPAGGIGRFRLSFFPFQFVEPPGQSLRRPAAVLLRFPDPVLEDREAETGDESVVLVGGGKIRKSGLHRAGLHREEEDPAREEHSREEKRDLLSPPDLVFPALDEEQNGQPGEAEEE